MKWKLILSLCMFCSLQSAAQTSPVSSLPPGRYETAVKNGPGKWDKGDIIFINDNQYKISTSPELGEFRFSVAAQRVFFISGPLKGVFAKTVQQDDQPAVLVPQAENQQIGLRLAPADIIAMKRQ